MKFIVLVLGLASLFLNSLNNISISKKTNPVNSTKVCFEQREFDFAHEFEKNETNLVISLKQFSKNDKKRTYDSIYYLCKTSFHDYGIQLINRSFLNPIFFFNKSQSILQVFLL